MIIDDAHWLDDAAQHLVEHLAFRLGTAAVAGQVARVCLLLVSRDGGSSRLISRLVDEPIIRRMSLGELDDREALELARRISPGITDRRTIARLVELSGGNPLTLNALADSIAVGEVLPPPASTTGTIPVEVAWRARLATLSVAARRAAVVIALAEQVVQRGDPAQNDLLKGADAALDELQSIGAVQRRAGGVGFTHPLLRTTALDLAPAELVCEVASELLDQLDRADGRAVAPGTLVRLSDAAKRTGTTATVNSCSWPTTTPSVTARGLLPATLPSNSWRPRSIFPSAPTGWIASAKRGSTSSIATRPRAG